MKSLSILLGIFLTLILLGCKNNSSPKSYFQVNDSWNLIFEDNFDNDLSLWNPWYGGAFNNEIQLYKPEQVSLNNGLLIITAQRESSTGPTTPFDASQKNFEYVSGRIESQRLFGPTDEDGNREYRFVASIKLPAGHGMWPAFWTYGDPWPTQGEIDIMEARGGEPNEFSSNLFYGPSSGVNINQGTEVHHTIGQDLTSSFHTYEMIWRATSIDIIFDDQLLHRYTANSGNNVDKMMQKQQKLVFNTAVGGWFISDQNSANFADNSRMEVDWVKVYKR
jgi:hypothetical protein